MNYRLIAILLFASQYSAFAQEEGHSKFTKAIEDNSYFIEEAYNQEDGIVQHISNGYYTFSPSKDFMYTFTQEWPVVNQKHQLSYTVGYSWLNSNKVNGFSDALINYRYQLTGHDDFITIAPRISVILPIGNENKGLGDGVVGYQLNIPMSKRITNGLVLHANAGFTLLPNVKTVDIDGIESKNTQSNVNLGLSAIWLVTPKLNLMFEVLQNISRVPDAKNKMGVVNQTIVSPGFRYAIDIKDLQIVPGIAVPTTVQDGKYDTGVFFYLSFEHPF